MAHAYIIHRNRLGCIISERDDSTRIDDPLEVNNRLIAYITVNDVQGGDTLEIREED